MSDLRRLSPVPSEPKPFVATEDFPAFAAEQWSVAKDAHAEAFQAISGVHYCLHKPGKVRVIGTVTGALRDARKLREQADRIVVALEAIVDVAKGTR